MRTESSIKNLIFAFGGQIIGIIISLISRLVFVKILSYEYLGLSGLFSNILAMLSLMELGVGSAMAYSLYKPLEQDDKEKIKSLMNLYKIIYRVIGTLIFVVGVFITPFLNLFIENIPDIKDINLIYILFVANTAVSYFYSYKRTLIISAQKRYIATFYKYLFYFLLNVSQIVILLITKNYILFLVTQVILTLLENIMISKKTDVLYPYLKEKNVQKLDEDTKGEIKKNIIAMIGHKIGGVIVNSTDNIIISKFVGLAEVGIYSNYYLITNALNTIASQIFNSIVASVGNLVATEDKDKTYEVFKKVFFLNFWIYGFASICLIVLFNDFIALWLGEAYTFSMTIVLIIVINFYVTGMRKAVLTFRDAMGLYWPDRYKPLFESVINLVVSIILVKKIGVLGVFIGTFVSSITTCFWIEPYILYKHGLKKNVVNYAKKYALYTIITVVIATLLSIICSYFKAINIINFIIKMLICIILFNLIFIVIFFKTDEFKYYKNLFLKMLNRLINKIAKKEEKYEQ